MVDFVTDQPDALVGETGLVVQGRDANRWRALLDRGQLSEDAIRARGATNVIATPVTLEELFIALGR